MDYAFSRDLGVTWMNNWGQQIANTRKQEAIVPVSAGITIFSIPKYGYDYCYCRKTARELIIIPEAS